MMGAKESLHKLPMIILVVLFGSGSWVAITGVWMELPLLVTLGIPEGYSLASYLVIIIQFANIGPLIFAVACYFFKGYDLEVLTVYIILPIGVIACLLMVFVWDLTTVVGGADHSTPLLILSFFMSLLGCTSTVAFTAFMSRLKNTYLTWYFVGEGISSLYLSLVALGQGVGTDVCVSNYTYINETSGQMCNVWVGQTLPANFPPENFFYSLFALVLLSLISFVLLNTLPLAKREYATEQLASTPEPSDPTKLSGESHQMSTNKSISTEQNEIETEVPELKRSTLSFVYLYVLLGYVMGMHHSVLPSVLGYSCGAYSADAYLLAATLSNVARPIFSFIVILYPKRSLLLIAIVTIVGTVAGGYGLATALLSPTPPLQYEIAGSVLVVLSYVVAMGFFTYAKVTIGWILRNEPDNRNLLIGFGIVSQVGTLVGACVMFPLINVLNLFTPYYGSPCDGYTSCES